MVSRRERFRNNAPHECPRGPGLPVSSNGNPVKPPDPGSVSTVQKRVKTEVQGKIPLFPVAEAPDVEMVLIKDLAGRTVAVDLFN